MHTYVHAHIHTFRHTYIHTYVRTMHSGRAGVILFDRLHFDPITSHWVRPKRAARGGVKISRDFKDLVQQGVPWMSRISRRCVAQLPCQDQPTEPSRTDPMQFTYYVLNLKRREERLCDFRQLARAAKLPHIQTTEAIDGQTLNVKDWQDSLLLTDEAAKAWETKQRPNDLACLLSQLILWRRIHLEIG